MSNYDVIRRKVDVLIALTLTDGVQPSDLVDNIFLDSYENVSYKKVNNQIVGEFVIKEKQEDEETYIILRYFYGQDKKVYRIEEEQRGQILIQWDRKIRESELINDIIDMMKICYASDQINKFISSLPEQIKSTIKKEYNNVA